MEIIAHRGASAYAPENTLAAFQLAVEHGVESIELDVRLTKDGIPVICHDARINRTSNGKGFIHKMTLEELKTYDFGSWFSPTFQGERIPTLEEVFTLLKGEQIDINIEIKQGPMIQAGVEQAVIDTTKKFGFTDRILVSSFDHVAVKRTKELCSDIKVGFLLYAQLINPFDYLEQSGVSLFSIHINYYYVTADLLEQAHARGMKVYAYTLDNTKTGKKLENMGLDGVITNKTLAFAQSRFA